MVSLSREALSSSNLKDYHRKELAASTSAYYMETARLKGEWYGRLTVPFDLEGQQVSAEHFDRLCDGQHPHTGEQLIKWRPEKQAEEVAWKTDAKAWADHLKGIYVQSVEAGHDPFAENFVPGPVKEAARFTQKPLAPVELTEKQRQLVAMHEEAAWIYRDNLAGPAGAKARAYLEGRGITPELAAEFGLGLSLPGNQLAARLAHYGPELMDASGLFAQRGGKFYDRQRERLMFPIQNQHGDTIAFAGRTLSKDAKQAKYLNSAATEIYTKGDNLYNLHRARAGSGTEGKTVVVEGYMDVIAAHSAGVRNVVATCGTALTEAQATRLSEIAPAVVLNFDGDKAGLDAVHNNWPTLVNEGLDVSVATLAAGSDPDDVVRHEGAAEYRRHLNEKAEPLMKWVFGAAQYDKTIEFKSDAVKRVADILEAVAPERREKFAEQWARHLHVPVEEKQKDISEHRAGWDATFSAPKSFSAAAIVGGDTRLIDLHNYAVKTVLERAEVMAQARMGGDNRPQTTGKWIVAVFLHDTSRPVDGYSAVQLHSHAVFFNLTEDKTGQARSMETHEIYKSRQYMTAAYRNIMEIGARRMGYEIVRGAGLAPEIGGFTPEYLASESERNAVIHRDMAAKGMVGAAAAQVSAYSTREAKLDLPPAEIKAMHLANAEKFGNQPQRIVAEAALRQAIEITPEESAAAARKAVNFARRHLSERNSVFEHRDVMTEALKKVRGMASLPEIERELDHQKANGKFITVHHVRPGAPLFRYTTPQLIDNERVAIERVLGGRDKAAPIGVPDIPANLNEDQQQVMRFVAASQDQILGIRGRAGTGKTTTLRAVNKMAQAAGYQTHGLGPTSRATKGLKEAGINSETLQRFLVAEQPQSGRRMYFLDESSLASGNQMRKFLERLGPEDRAVIVGDERQHGSVEAGRIFGELQQAGMRSATLSKIVRQKDPELVRAIESLNRGDVKTGIGMMAEHGWITTVKRRGDRFKAIAKDYAADPAGCLVISPDNHSRKELNDAIRGRLRESGSLGEDIYQLRILVNRQNITGVQRAVAGSYQEGDEVRYRKGSADLGFQPGDYATVLKADIEANMVMVKRARDGRIVTYDPEQLQGVSIYEPEVRNFAAGDRIQFTAPSRKLAIDNRDMGTVTFLDEAGNMRVELEGGRTVGFNLKTHKHIDHAYVMTSHISQGVTVARVLVHVDTGDSRVQALINETLAYVAISRPELEARIYTDDETKLVKSLQRHEEKSTALAPAEIRKYKSLVA